MRIGEEVGLATSYSDDLNVTKTMVFVSVGVTGEEVGRVGENLLQMRMASCPTSMRGSSVV